LKHNYLNSFSSLILQKSLLRFPKTPHFTVENSKLFGCGIVNHHSRCRINDIKMRTRYFR